MPKQTFNIQYLYVSQVAHVMNLPASGGDAVLIPGSERPQKVGNGNPLQKSHGENSQKLPKKSHGQRSLEGCSPWTCKESDMTEQLSTHMYTK